jgi:hypothetical protein
MWNGAPRDASALPFDIRSIALSDGGTAEFYCGVLNPPGPVRNGAVMYSLGG